jgi:hypothetical protein
MSEALSTVNCKLALATRLVPTAARIALGVKNTRPRLAPGLCRRMSVSAPSFSFGATLRM